MKKAIYFALENLGLKEANKFIKKVLRESSFNDLKSKKKTFSQLDLKVKRKSTSIRRYLILFK
jgi:hypothetical protein